MNQWQMAKRLASCNHCDDFSCRGLVADMLNSGGVSCPLLQATEPDSWDMCCVTSEHGIQECAQKWMSNHPELNPELDRLNEDVGGKRIWPDTWIGDVAITEALFQEVARAELKHPEWPKDLIYQAAILNEESGELMKACLEYQFEPRKAVPVDELVKEAIQVGAMAIRFLKNFPCIGDILDKIKTESEEGHL